MGTSVTVCLHTGWQDNKHSLSACSYSLLLGATHVIQTHIHTNIYIYPDGCVISPAKPPQNKNQLFCREGLSMQQDIEGWSLCLSKDKDSSYCGRKYTRTMWEQKGLNFLTLPPNLIWLGTTTRISFFFLSTIREHPKENPCAQILQRLHFLMCKWLIYKAVSWK